MEVSRDSLQRTGFSANPPEVSVLAKNFLEKRETRRDKVIYQTPKKKMKLL